MFIRKKVHDVVLNKADNNLYSTYTVDVMGPNSAI